MLEQLRHGGYGGRLSAVSPNRRQVLGIPCFPCLEALPEAPEHVVFCILNRAVEPELARAAALGVEAATLVSSLLPEDDRKPPLKERVRAIAREAGMLICGADGNGFYNFDQGLWACGFATRRDHRRCGITLLTHSGSLFGALLDCEARLDYNLAVSTGQELTTSLADYMDFALAQPTTRVIGLFLETVRDPAGFVATLEKANQRRVPVIALKVGRSARAAAMATGHSGALVGNDRAYDALFTPTASPGSRPSTSWRPPCCCSPDRRRWARAAWRRCTIPAASASFWSTWQNASACPSPGCRRGPKRPCAPCSSRASSPRTRSTPGAAARTTRPISEPASPRSWPTPRSPSGRSSATVVPAG